MKIPSADRLLLLNANLINSNRRNCEGSKAFKKNFCQIIFYVKEMYYFCVLKW